MVTAKDIRSGFRSGRVTVVPAAINKPAKPIRTPRIQTVEASTTRPPSSAAQEKTKSQPIKVAGLTLERPPTPAPAVILNRTRPKARIKTSGIKQSRLVVRLLDRVVPARLAKKRAILEAVPVNARYRLEYWGVTSDGETVLPKRTTEVRLELRDLTAEVEVIVEERPAGSRKKYAPKRWIHRRLQRPGTDKWRRPKPAT